MNFREKRERLHYLLHRKAFLSSSAFLKLYLPKKPNTEENQEGTYFSSFIVIFYITHFKGFVNSCLYINKRVFVRLYICICLFNCFFFMSEKFSELWRRWNSELRERSRVGLCSKFFFCISLFKVFILRTHGMFALNSKLCFFSTRTGPGHVFIRLPFSYFLFKMQNWFEKLLIS